MKSGEVNALFKNLPQFVQVSEQSDDLKRFINISILEDMIFIE